MCAISIGRQNRSRPLKTTGSDIADAIPTGNDGGSMSNSIGDNLQTMSNNLANTAKNKQKLTASDNYQG